jgi:dihydrofolate reductase
MDADALQCVKPVCLVVAYARNRVIGREGEMPWHLRSDLRHFKALTLGHPVIMGRKTFHSIGRPLPGRTNIVVTRDRTFAAEGVQVAASVDKALTVAAGHAQDRIMVIGGGEIYAQTLSLADYVFATEIDAEPEGDAFFPPLPHAQWRETAREARIAGENDDYPFAFVTYEKI